MIFFWATIAPIVGYFILTYGVFVQTRRIIQRKSSQDIALTEIGLRMLASILLFVKFWTMPDQLEVAIGQSVFLLFYIVYAILVLRYRSTPEPRPL
ncbi:MAG: hypothetical protein Q7R62_01740 [bacterium]|nr:hypothetical protein [bacterium]